MDRRCAARPLIAALVMAGVLSACGQKGPLFLPDQKLEEIKRKKEERERAREQNSKAGTDTQSRLHGTPATRRLSA